MLPITNNQLVRKPINRVLTYPANSTGGLAESIDLANALLNSSEATQMALAFKRLRVERVQVEFLWNFRFNTTSGVNYNAVVFTGYSPNNNVSPAAAAAVLDN